MAALQLGGSVLGALLEVVFDKFSSEAIRRMGSMREIEDDIFKLRITLRKIKSMLVSAEEHKVEDLKEWIDKVRDVTYMVEDFLDELELAHVQRDEESGTLRSLMPRFAHDLIDSSNIQDIQRKVDHILHLAEYYDLKKSENIVKKLEWRETSSILDDEMVIGRDAVKTQMIQMLMSESTKEESYDVIPIIGMGGVDKNERRAKRLMRRHTRNLRRMRDLRRRNMDVEALEYFGDVEDVYSSSDSEYERPVPVWDIDFPEDSDGEDGVVCQQYYYDYDSDDSIPDYEIWSDPDVGLNYEGEKANGVLAVEIPLPPHPPQEFFDNI